MADLRVAFYDDPVFREHDAGPGHPERPGRLDAVARGLDRSGLRDRVQVLRPREAHPSEILLVHTEAHLSAVAATRGRHHRFDADTVAGPRSYSAALLAAGAVVDAVDRVLDGELDRAFCAVRPPGHHAEADRAMGFCLFNNVAVGVAHALNRGLSRVMVVDFDVHHGNGTQAIFEDDPRVLYLSSHAYPFYPGTGGIDETGEGRGRGFTVNLPLSWPCGDAEYARLYRELAEPIGRAFDPELLLVSAGFDAARGDPLAFMGLSPAGFAEITDVCLRVASGAARGRAVFVLEGGYSLEALESGTEAVLRLLLGESHLPLALAPAAQMPGLVESCRRALAPYWPALAPA